MSYNGWTNYETWCVKLWMDNVESSDRYWCAVTEQVYRAAEAGRSLTKLDVAKSDLAKILKTEHEEAQSSLEVKGLWSDLLSAALSEVDWCEIAGSLLDDYADDEDDEEDTP